MTETTTQLTVEELEERRDAAREELYGLEQRASGECQAQIRETRRQLRRAQVESAKKGRDQGEVSARLKLESLEAELQELPETLFYARLRSIGAGLGVEEAKVREAEPRLEEARKEAAPLLSRAKAARKKADQARAHCHALRRQLPRHLLREDTLPGEVQAAEETASAAEQEAEQAEAESRTAQRHLNALQAKVSNARDAGRRLKKTLKSVEDAGVRPIA